FFSSRRRHTRFSRDWSSDVCSSDLMSAFSTTGISPDLTGTLSLPSQIVLMLLMFVGRLGPLTLVYSLGTQRRSRVRYPETMVQRSEGRRGGKECKRRRSAEGGQKET